MMPFYLWACVCHSRVALFTRFFNSFASMGQILERLIEATWRNDSAVAEHPKFETRELPRPALYNCGNEAWLELRK